MFVLIRKEGRMDGWMEGGRKEEKERVEVKDRYW